MKAYVKSIEALKQTNQPESINIFRVELTLKPEWKFKECVVPQKSEPWIRNFTYE